MPQALDVEPSTFFVGKLGGLGRIFGLYKAGDGFLLAAQFNHDAIFPHLHQSNTFNYTTLFYRLLVDDRAGAIAVEDYTGQHELREDRGSFCHDWCWDRCLMWRCWIQGSGAHCYRRANQQRVHKHHRGRSGNDSAVEPWTFVEAQNGQFGHSFGFPSATDT